MKYLVNPKLRTFRGVFKQLDFFGVPVLLTFQGKANYQTALGALTSLAIFIFLTFTAFQHFTKVAD